MSIYLRISKGVRDHFYVRRSEWACAAVITWWGVSLLSPGNTFSISLAYLGLAQIASERTWGILCGTIGVLRLIALSVNGTFQNTWYSKYSPHVRSATAGLTAVIFIMITAGILFAPTPVWPLSTGLGTYAVLAWLDTVSAMGTGREAGWSQKENRGGLGELR